MLGEPTTAAVPGFLVWESNRSGSWQLWIRDLEVSEPRQLTPDERGRRHCCAHVSPDGAWITYLSLPEGKQEYSKGDARGVLRLIRPDGSEERELAADARTYFEHRAAIWRSERELIYIDGEGRTVVVDIESGEVTLLTEESLEAFGSLIDSQLQWATNGRGEFMRYQARGKQVVERFQNRGCQPYFSHDGRWGFWTAGVGGPINRFDLATGRASPILHKNDDRMPPGLGYLYFPMLSRDGSMLAFAASRNQHDHFRSDYEIFVVETDPDKLEVIGTPVRMTADPATDRFPDVFVEPLPLGRQSGEAPLAVSWSAPGDGDWRWQLGDGAAAEGGGVSHVYEQPGRFVVTASRGDRMVRGLVTVAPARPPAVLSAALRERGLRIEVVFDEPLGAEPQATALASGTAITGVSLSADGRTLVLEPEQPIRSSDTLLLSGLVDRATPPNRADVEIDLEPPLWPSDRDALAFVWAHGAALNQVFDSELGTDRACVVNPQGRAVLDHDFTMVLGRGTFLASERDMETVLGTLRATNRMTLEATVAPGTSGRLIGMGGLHLNFVLRAEASKLHISIRTGNRGPGAFQGAAVADYRPGEPLHLVVTYAPGDMRAYVDGEPAGEWPVTGDFFNWRRYPLVFGEDLVVAPGTMARVEGVAIYGRILDADEARENFLRYQALRAARQPVARTVVEAELIRRSKAPSLVEINPYREALATHEWRVLEQVPGECSGEGSGPVPGQVPGECQDENLQQGALIRVAQWAILDGKFEPPLGEGARSRLTLEPFDRNPQLEGTFVADDLGAGGGRLYYRID